MTEPTTDRPPAPVAVSAPVLPSTADAVPYVPVSWMAVAAGLAAGLLVLLMVVLGFVAFRAHKPLLEDWLLALAAAAVVLSFAARRVVRNSEGTRTGVLFGIDLPNAAWWTGLVLGLGYTAYLLAIAFAISRDAKAEAGRWADYVLKGDPENLTRAFYRTRNPGERATIRPDDRGYMEGRWGAEFVAFQQCDLARLAARSRGECRFTIGGVHDWAYEPTGVRCKVGGTITSPEGVFPVVIELRGFDPVPGAEGAGGRQWQVAFTQTGYVNRDQVQLTPYGWYMVQLDVTAADYGRRFVAACAGGPERRAVAFREFVRPDDPVLRPLTPATVAGLGALPLLGWAGSAKVQEYIGDQLFRLPGGAAPSEGQKKEFLHSWRSVGILRAGERLRENTGVHDELKLTAAAVEVRVPVEIPAAGVQADGSAARGRVVVECTDPEVLATIKRLHETAADPDRTAAAPPDDLLRKAIPWKVTRIETDLRMVSIRPQGPGGGPPPPGGPTP